MAVILEGFVKEAFDNIDDEVVKLITQPRNKKIKELLNNVGIDLRSIKSKAVGGSISNRSPLWKDDIKTAISNGRLLAMVFPSGYLYIPGADNNEYVSREDSDDDIGYLTKYNQLSKNYVSNMADAYILSFDPKIKRDKYQDPRYTDNGEYAGQVKNPNYDPDSEYDYYKQKYIDRTVPTRRSPKRDKSGYLVRSMADMKAQLYNKFKSGDLDTELYKRFKECADMILAATKRFRDIDLMSAVPEYNKDFTSYKDPKHNLSYMYTNVSSKLNNIISDYRSRMDMINDTRRWDDSNVGEYVKSIDILKNKIKELSADLDKLESLV